MVGRRDGCQVATENRGRKISKRREERNEGGRWRCAEEERVRTPVHVR